MRRPKYYLNTKIMVGEHEIEPGIEIQPISDYLLPDHKKEEYVEATKFSAKPMVMCIIGMHWVIIPKEFIKEVK